ncbi:hypothetical protein [Paraburkholderia sediminicola]|uniref:hypothetical protein n=1 Tax=Paraburkholderia sediminicola TaxID=458836 RepID=UPI0038B83F6D
MTATLSLQRGRGSNLLDFRVDCEIKKIFPTPLAPHAGKTEPAGYTGTLWNGNKKYQVILYRVLVRGEMHHAFKLARQANCWFDWMNSTVNAVFRLIEGTPFGQKRLQYLEGEFARIVKKSQAETRATNLRNAKDLLKTPDDPTDPAGETIKRKLCSDAPGFYACRPNSKKWVDPVKRMEDAKYETGSVSQEGGCFSEVALELLAPGDVGDERYTVQLADGQRRVAINPRLLRGSSRFNSYVEETHRLISLIKQTEDPVLQRHYESRVTALSEELAVEADKLLPDAQMHVTRLFEDDKDGGWKRPQKLLFNVFVDQLWMVKRSVTDAFMECPGGRSLRGEAPQDAEARKALLGQYGAALDMPDLNDNSPVFAICGQVTVKMDLLKTDVKFRTILVEEFCKRHPQLLDGMTQAEIEDVTGTFINTPLAF